MPYLNLDFDFFDHPKTLRMIGILGPGGAEVAIRLWSKVGKFFARTGVLHGHSVVEIEALIGWWGKPGDAVAALEKVGFIERHGDSFAVHDWKHHQGHIHALKMRNRKVAINRWENMRGKRRKRQVSDGTSGINMVHQNTNPGVPLAVPFLSNPIHSIPTKESTALAEKLRVLILGNNPKARTPDDLSAWAESADLMMSADKRTFHEIESVISFSQRDDFWKANILSMPTLRKQFDKLWMKMQGGSNGNWNQGHNQTHIVGGAAPVPGKYAGIINKPG